MTSKLQSHLCFSSLFRSQLDRKEFRKKHKKKISLHFLEWPRARDEKSRLEFYFSISLQNRHSSGSAVVSCLRSLMVNSRTFGALPELETV